MLVQVQQVQQLAQPLLELVQVLVLMHLELVPEVLEQEDRLELATGQPVQLLGRPVLELVLRLEQRQVQLQVVG